MKRVVPIALACGAAAAAVLVAATVVGAPREPAAPGYVANDSHIHLTNYVQEGITAQRLLEVMGDKVERAALFGIPLQQMWSYRVAGNNAPTYYLDTDSDLYYYSFTDAQIAMAYKSLTKPQQARFDPMITGFNPADMYAADHVRRVLETFPDTFVGIGEFSLHKEFVTAKVAGDPPSIDDPALDRLLAFAGDVGLLVLVHCDVDTPFPHAGEDPAYLSAIHDMFKRHPNTTFIWAHIGLGRVVRPVKDQAMFVKAMLDNPKLRNVYFDLSWSETAKYLVSTPATTKLVADLLTAHPDRFLFGTDEVAPANQDDYLRVYRQYEPLWDVLPAAVSEQVRRGNYVRLFDDARRKVRRWEREHRARAQELGALGQVQPSASPPP